MAGTRQALAELMAWSGIEEQGEAITLMIHHLHALGPQKSAPLLTPPRHEITISENVSRKLELAYNREALRICHDEYPPPQLSHPVMEGGASRLMPTAIVAGEESALLPAALISVNLRDQLKAPQQMPFQIYAVFSVINGDVISVIASHFLIIDNKGPRPIP
ncbi:hypothetical protein D3C73_922680 [compost metagenome]